MNTTAAFQYLSSFLEANIKYIKDVGEEMYSGGLVEVEHIHPCRVVINGRQFGVENFNLNISSFQCLHDIHFCSFQSWNRRLYQRNFLHTIQVSAVLQCFEET